MAKSAPKVKTAPKVAVAECPECETNIRFHNPLKRGQIVTCPECHERLQVDQLDPLELDWAYEDPDDEDDYEEWD